MGDLAKIQNELDLVKTALRDGKGYLGMQGDKLHTYLFQLNEKENLILSGQLGRSPASPALGLGVGPVASTPIAPFVPARAAIQPRAPPPGEPPAFDKGSVAAALTHMCDYEANPTECSKALKAFASLSYSDKLKVGEDDRVLEQILRITLIHSSDSKIQLGAVRVLSNVAYDKNWALKRLAQSSVLSTLIFAMASHPDSKDIEAKASEAIARIVMAEWNPDGSEVAETKVPRTESGSLEAFFTAAIASDVQSHAIVIRVILQLPTNQVVAAAPLAERFVKVVQEDAGSAGAAFGWLALARQLASAPALDAGDLPVELVSAGGIKTALKLMDRYIGEAAVQLAGVEALSCLVGNRVTHLQAFANNAGVSRIAQAMTTHGTDKTLQTKGIRAMASAIAWPEDLQVKSGYKTKVAVDLTKVAMTQHHDELELQKAALEALAKYLEKQKCKDDVLEKGGEGLVKAVVARHSSDDKVAHWGKVVLESLKK